MKPGTVFRRGENRDAYIVVDERVVPHSLSGEFIVDSLYVPGSGVLCCCCSTGELSRMHITGSCELEELTVGDMLDSLSEGGSVHKSLSDLDAAAASALQALGARRKP